MPAEIIKMNKAKHSSPWWWVPTLYFAEGVPYFLVNNISVMLFAKMGVPNDQLAFFTTLLYFPWFLKGLWSPLVDVVKTKRWWIVAMQLLMASLCVLLTVSLPHPDAAMMAAKGTPVSMFWLTLVLFIITAFASATHDIAADGYYMIAHDSGSQARFIGIRSTFYRIAMVFGQGVLVFIAGRFEKSTGDIPLSWQLTLGITAVILFAVTIYHIFALPRVERAIGKESGRSPKVGSQKSEGACEHSDKSQELSIGEAFKTFFTKKGVVLAICFMLLYRMAEGLLVKLSLPFLVDSREVIEREGQLIGGGLGLDTDVVGFIYGTIGVLFLLLGGILGGIYISRRGLKRSIWLMAASLTLPNLVYVYLSGVQPTNLWLIGSAISFEQFGYGFGFTAYMMYMMYFAQSKVGDRDVNYSTSHYAICTAFMALSMMLPGFVAGKIEMSVGYYWFFWIAVLCSVTTFAVTYFVHRQIDSEYGCNK